MGRCLGRRRPRRAAGRPNGAPDERQRGRDGADRRCAGPTASAAAGDQSLNGVYRSVDGGRTWALAGVNTPVPFGEAMALSPSFLRDRTIVAGGGDGVYRSSDAGETWQRVLFGSRVLSLAAANDAGARETWLVGTDTYGILRSTDDGARW